MLTPGQERALKQKQQSFSSFSFATINIIFSSLLQSNSQMTFQEQKSVITNLLQFVFEGYVQISFH